MPENFLKTGLNNIMKRLTGIDHFFSKHEMDCNAMGIYFGDKSEKGVQRQKERAEKKVTRFSIPDLSIKISLFFIFRLFDIWLSMLS